MTSTVRLRLLIRRLATWKAVAVAAVPGTLVVVRTLEGYVRSSWFTAVELLSRIFWCELGLLAALIVGLIIRDVSLGDLVLAAPRELRRLWAARRNPRAAALLVTLAVASSVLCYEGYYWFRGKQFAWRIASIAEREKAWAAFDAGRTGDARTRLERCRTLLDSPACASALAALDKRIERASLLRTLYGRLPTSSVRKIDVLSAILDLERDRTFFTAERSRLWKLFSTLTQEYRQALGSIVDGDSSGAKAVLLRLQKQESGFGDAEVLLEELPRCPTKAELNPARCPYLSTLHSAGVASFAQQVLGSRRASFVTNGAGQR